MRRQRKVKVGREELVKRCLTAFVKAGTIELSLDQLAKQVKISKRMLVHYFGGREEIEENCMALLEHKLRAQFAPAAFPPGADISTVMQVLWEQTTSVERKGVLLLVMDISRQAWKGSARAKAFYTEQQRLWVLLLMNYLSDQMVVEEALQLFQGAVLAYLVTGDPQPGRRSLMRFLESKPVAN